VIYWAKVKFGLKATLRVVQTVTLIKAMGSEQASLTGSKGSIVRKVAVGRSASSLEKLLAAIKNILEGKQ
jgi:hypothetical protein